MSDQHGDERVPGPPDPIEWQDVSSTAEHLDEDELDADPLEEGVEPPEGWAAADRFGTTPNEQREGPVIDDRLAAEEPDVSPGEP
ncbi:hypothetical protein [Nocardia mexicana]|uniref:DUF5709 domain-containing protein n=1 Tax=Nocardia mexicana TaxID=279262 RepID=A0A370HF90_9NOCA|nr:hypothetical protein [Nocardia mexicana]RDI55863.1 hypothetical protein DFR68_101699 [Nocardia mexicana]